MADLKQLISKEADKQIAALAKMEASLDKNAVKLQRQLFELIRDKFMDTLATDQAGNLLYNTANINRVNDMVKTWEYFQKNQFTPEVLALGKDLLSIVEVEAGYFTAIGKQFDIPVEFGKVTDLISKQIGITLDKKPSIIPGSYLDRLAEGAAVRDKITNTVLESVSAKASFKDLKATLEEVIMGSDETNGAMTKYLRTYAYDSFSAVQRTVDLHMADTYGMNCFVYEGNLIKDSREFCIEHLGQIICRDQFEEIEAQDWQGKNPDIPFEISLGGYNCRHTAMWIPDEAVKTLEGEKEEAPVKYEDGGEVFEANLGNGYKYAPLPETNWMPQFTSRLESNGIKLIRTPETLTKIDADNILEGLERSVIKYDTKLLRVNFKPLADAAGTYRSGDITISNAILNNSKPFKYQSGKNIQFTKMTVGQTVKEEGQQLMSTLLHEGYHATYYENNLHSVWVDALKRNFGIKNLDTNFERAKKYEWSKRGYKGFELTNAQNTAHEQSFRILSREMKKLMGDDNYNISDYWLSSAWESFSETGAQIELGYKVDPRLVKAFKETLSAIKY